MICDSNGRQAKENKNSPSSLLADKRLIYPITALNQARFITDELENITNQYTRAHFSYYTMIIETLEKSKKLKATAFYWKGLCYNRLFEYDKAVSSFKRAIKYKSKAKDLRSRLDKVFTHKIFGYAIFFLILLDP